MAKARNVDAKLNRLRALRQESSLPTAELHQSLADASNIVAAEAAEIVGERRLPEFVPALVATFDRFMIRPAETDKLCRAKIAVIETLNKLEYDNEEIYLRGVRHVQMEPRWGGSEDTAGPLRGHCAFGLVQMNYREVGILLADLLADGDKAARMMAAQALGATRSPAAIPLLRFKARVGDQEPEVVGECLTALMVATPKESLPFVASFLDSANMAVQQAAAMALGESRRPEAMAILIAFWSRTGEYVVKETVLLAISMTRLAGGIEFLLERVASESTDLASLALSALAIHRHNDAVTSRIVAILADRGDSALRERYRKKFVESV